MSWECAQDLAACVERQVSDEAGLFSPILKLDPPSISIAELGCGRGAPTCALLVALDRVGFPGAVSATFQDMDESTIESVTKPFVESELVKLSIAFRSRLTIKFKFSTWDALDIPRESQDIILSSECIYRGDLFASHAGVLTRALSPNGIAVIAGKRYYFGCGGGTIEFSEYLLSQSAERGWKIDLVSVFEDGMSNTREIISVSRSC